MGERSRPLTTPETEAQFSPQRLPPRHKAWFFLISPCAAIPSLPREFSPRTPTSGSFPTSTLLNLTGQVELEFTSAALDSEQPISITSLMDSSTTQQPRF